MMAREECKGSRTGNAPRLETILNVGPLATLIAGYLESEEVFAVAATCKSIHEMISNVVALPDLSCGAVVSWAQLSKKCQQVARVDRLCVNGVALSVLPLTDEDVTIFRSLQVKSLEIHTLCDPRIFSSPCATAFSSLKKLSFETKLSFYIGPLLNALPEFRELEELHVRQDISGMEFRKLLAGCPDTLRSLTVFLGHWSSFTLGLNMSAAHLRLWERVTMPPPPEAVRADYYFLNKQLEGGPDYVPAGKLGYLEELHVEVPWSSKLIAQEISRHCRRLKILSLYDYATEQENHFRGVLDSRYTISVLSPAIERAMENRREFAAASRLGAAEQKGEEEESVDHSNTEGNRDSRFEENEDVQPQKRQRIADLAWQRLEHTVSRVYSLLRVIPMDETLGSIDCRAVVNCRGAPERSVSGSFVHNGKTHFAVCNGDGTRSGLVFPDNHSSQLLSPKAFAERSFAFETLPETAVISKQGPPPSSWDPTSRESTCQYIAHHLVDFEEAAAEAGFEHWKSVASPTLVEAPFFKSLCRGLQQYLEKGGREGLDSSSLIELCNAYHDGLSSLAIVRKHYHGQYFSQPAEVADMGIMTVAATMTKLRQLNLSGPKITAASLSVVSEHLHELEVLRLQGAQLGFHCATVGDEMLLSVLLNCPALESLNVSQCTWLTERGLFFALALKRLERLVINSIPLDEGSFLRLLEQNPDIVEGCLSGDQGHQQGGIIPLRQLAMQRCDGLSPETLAAVLFIVTFRGMFRDAFMDLGVLLRGREDSHADDHDGQEAKEGDGLEVDDGGSSPLAWHLEGIAGQLVAWNPNAWGRMSLRLHSLDLSGNRSGITEAVVRGLGISGNSLRQLKLGGFWSPRGVMFLATGGIDCKSELMLRLPSKHTKTAGDGAAESGSKSEAGEPAEGSGGEDILEDCTVGAAAKALSAAYFQELLRLASQARHHMKTQELEVPFMRSRSGFGMPNLQLLDLSTLGFEPPPNLHEEQDSGEWSQQLATGDLTLTSMFTSSALPWLCPPFFPSLWRVHLPSTRPTYCEVLAAARPQTLVMQGEANMIFDTNVKLPAPPHATP